GLNVGLIAAFFNFALMACSAAGSYLIWLAYARLNGGTIDYNNPSEFIAVLGLMALTSFAVNSVLSAVYTGLKSGRDIWGEWNRNCLS
uniref:hypothetical protein n=1 Tax=Citrobacter freundii TaxID=546 RepID=UPI0020009F59